MLVVLLYKLQQMPVRMDLTCFLAVLKMLLNCFSWKNHTIHVQNLLKVKTLNHVTTSTAPTVTLTIKMFSILAVIRKNLRTCIVVYQSGHWTVTSYVTNSPLWKLLKVLRIEHPDLPKDPQSIRDIHKNVELTSVAGGQSFISVKHHHKSRFW